MGGQSPHNDANANDGISRTHQYQPFHGTGGDSHDKRCTFTYALNGVIGVISKIVFACLDLLDFALCMVYRWVDYLLEKEWTPCYCWVNGLELEGCSKTLYSRKNFARSLMDGVVSWISRSKFFCGGSYKKNDWANAGAETDGQRVKSRGKVVKNLVSRWSDCGCYKCISYDMEKLYVALGGQGYQRHASGSNIIFIHGFLSSSSFWTRTIYPAFSEAAKANYRFFAVDLLGFGKSPKPFNCLYTIEEHIDMIERSVLNSYHLKSFHLVGHSMGCIIALALASKYPNASKSITLLAPPYFPAASGEQASEFMMKNFAPKKIWPPVSFGSSVMSWYEHVGRTVCLVACKNHKLWEWIVKQLAGNRVPYYRIEDISRHTHYSAWHTYHNVICGAAPLIDKYLEIIRESDCEVMILHGKKDIIVPLQCSLAIKLRVDKSQVKVLDNADHTTVVAGREKVLAGELEEFWASCG